MVIALIGESCTGKSSIAQEFKKRLSADVIAGKDYLKMARSQSEAEIKFKNYLFEKQDSSEMVIYVISEIENLNFLPNQTLKIHCTAPLDTIKERFAKRMNGNLPAPVALMLERKHGVFDSGEYELTYDTTQKSSDAICKEIISFLGK